jgi:hypothetical protein
MATFDLILEYQRPVAAIIAERLPAEQLKVIYALLPPNSVDQPAIADRWNASLVLAPNDWASEQLRREPMFRPKGHAFSFASDSEPKSRALTDLDAAFKIIHLVSERFQVSLKDLESKKRPWCIAWPRFFAMALIRDNTRLPLEKIGTLFNRDHSNVLHGVRAVADRIATDKADSALFSELQEQTAAALGRPSTLNNQLSAA